MVQRKRLPPWEEAKLVFKMQEETRKRKLLEEDMQQRRGRKLVFKMQEETRKRKLLEEDMQQRRGRAKRTGPNTSDELEENRKRLRALQKRIEDEDDR